MLTRENPPSHRWKTRVARAVQRQPLRWLMHLAINVVVPRHRVGVGVVVVNADHELLLLRHVFHPHAPWGVPSGWLGRNEQPEHGALRELHEETGLHARLGPVVYLQHSQPHSVVNIFYLAYTEPGPTKLSFEILEAAWFAPEAIPATMLPMTRTGIERGVAFVRQFGRIDAPIS